MIIGLKHHYVVNHRHIQVYPVYTLGETWEKDFAVMRGGNKGRRAALGMNAMLL
jgi:hypothetical protein